MFDDLSLDGKYEQEARALRGVIEALANDPDALDNMESYLSRHFSAWLETYVKSDPENLVGELELFSNAYGRTKVGNGIFDLETKSRERRM